MSQCVGVFNISYIRNMESQLNSPPVKIETNTENVAEKPKEEDMQLLQDIQATEKFIAEFADKSQLFFNSNNLLLNPMPLVQKLWKSQMGLIASKKYSQFNREQINRLVDRDWDYLTHEDHMEIADKFLNLSPEEVQAESLRIEYEIEDEMNKMKK